MKIKKPIFLLILLFVNVSMISHVKGIQMDDQLSEEDRVFYGFMQKEGNSLGNKYGMSLSSLGGGGGEDRIWLMSISFDREGPPLSEINSRSLIIKVVNEYLEAVNQDKSLRPHLRDYPFTAKNVNIKIFNYDKQRNCYYYPFIFIVGANQGKIGYFTKEETKEFGYKTVKHETYDEAVALLKHQNSQG